MATPAISAAMSQCRRLSHSIPRVFQIGGPATMNVDGTGFRTYTEYLGTDDPAEPWSPDGNWIAGSSYGTARIAFRWSQAGGMQNLGTLPGGTGAEASSISGDGSTVVGTADNADGDFAMRWTA